MSKYNNHKCTYDGYNFDSVKEKNRYIYLKELVKEGKIQDLKLQVRFQLQPSFKLENKTIRGIDYIADFVYFDKEKQRIIVEDTKGYLTEVYKLKKKLFMYKYQFEIKEL